MKSFYTTKLMSAGGVRNRTGNAGAKGIQQGKGIRLLVRKEQSGIRLQ